MRAAPLFTALSLSLASFSARAEPPARAGLLSDAEVSRRLDFLQTRFDRGTPAAQQWWYGWYAGYAALTMGQGAVAFAAIDPGLRADMAVGAVTSSLGLVPLGLVPFEPLYAAADLRAHPATTPEERRRKLARGERLLRESAEVEAFGRSWVTHALGGGVAIASGVVLSLAYERVLSGVLNAVAGVAVTELQIFTQPTAAIDDWKDYSSGAAIRRASAVNRGRSAWRIAPHPGGLGIARLF